MQQKDQMPSSCSASPVEQGRGGAAARRRSLRAGLAGLMILLGIGLAGCAIKPRVQRGGVTYTEIVTPGGPVRILHDREVLMSHPETKAYVDYVVAPTPAKRRERLAALLDIRLQTPEVRRKMAALIEEDLAEEYAGRSYLVEPTLMSLELRRSACYEDQVRRRLRSGAIAEENLADELRTFSRVLQGFQSFGKLRYLALSWMEQEVTRGARRGEFRGLLSEYLTILSPILPTGRVLTELGDIPATLYVNSVEPEDPLLRHLSRANPQIQALPTQTGITFRLLYLGAQVRAVEVPYADPAHAPTFAARRAELLLAADRLARLSYPFNYQGFDYLEEAGREIEGLPEGAERDALIARLPQAVNQRLIPAEQEVEAIKIQLDRIWESPFREGADVASLFLGDPEEYLSAVHWSILRLSRYAADWERMAARLAPRAYERDRLRRLRARIAEASGDLVIAEGIARGTLPLSRIAEGLNAYRRAAALRSAAVQAKREYLRSRLIETLQGVLDSGAVLDDEAFTQLVLIFENEGAESPELEALRRRLAEVLRVRAERRFGRALLTRDPREDLAGAVESYERAEMLGVKDLQVRIDQIERLFGKLGAAGESSERARAGLPGPLPDDDH
jgi:hypothetical protein